MLHDKADVVNAIEEAEKLRKDYDVVIYESQRNCLNSLIKFRQRVLWFLLPWRRNKRIEEIRIKAKLYNKIACFVA